MVGKSSSSVLRRGRRPGSNATRQTILSAARLRFASDGFTATTIRRVAADAGVDASLVMQFFGSKNELFAAVMSISPEVLARLSTAFEGPEEHLGERVVRAHLEAWEGTAQDSDPLMAMLRGAVAQEQAGVQLREFIQARLVDGVRSRSADHGGGSDEAADSGLADDAAMRAGLACSMLVGIVMGRRVVAVPALADADPETLISIVGPAIQSVLAPASPVQSSRAVDGSS